MARNRALGAICTTMVQMAIVPNGEFVSAAGDRKGGRSVCKDAWNLELHLLAKNYVTYIEHVLMEKC